MIEAYHIIGLSDLDQGRVASERAHAEILAHVQDRYACIVQSGFLRPASVEDVHRTFALDRLAGDNEYVFLSIGKRYWSLLEDANYGFVFDAEQLIRAGAILRSQDLLSSYEEALEEVTQGFIPFADPSTWTSEQITALFQSLEDDGQTDSFPSNDAYYALRDAIERQDTAYPHVKEAIALLKERMHALQQRVQGSGETALRLLYSGEAQGYELLVSTRLSLDYAIAHIISGQTRTK